MVWDTNSGNASSRPISSFRKFSIDIRKHAQRPGLQLFVVYVVVAFACGIALTLSGVFTRAELQTINQRFESRRWLKWTPESLQRLNPQKLYNYHEEHEIPRKWFAWDYTLSWLIEENHPKPKHNIVIFNHLLEDEPPLEAIKAHPWMKPLLTYPMSRTAVADILRYLADAQVKLIILDNDFPQYREGDRILAQAIHDLKSGATGRKTPVLMASTVNRRSSDRVLQVQQRSSPTGVLEQLSEIENVDADSTPIRSNPADEHLGTTGVLLDEDQVVRRMVCKMPTSTGEEKSIVVKALEQIGETVPTNLPVVMDIDFAGPPNSEAYPVRPITYLLNPETKREMKSSQSEDVTLKDAIVVLGDGVVDVYSTPLTNLGVNQRSGSEILVQALETISRQSWPRRLSPSEEVIFLMGIVLLAAGLHVPLRKGKPSTRADLQRNMFRGLFLDLVSYIFMIATAFITAHLLFAYTGLIVPLVVPAVALTIGALAATLWERDRERLEALQQQLKAAQEKLALAQGKYEAEIELQTNKAKTEAMVADRIRRKEFAQRINHDLKAPVSVLNWTLAKLINDGLDSHGAELKVQRLVKTSDHLVTLIQELVRSYDEASSESDDRRRTVCDVAKVVGDIVSLEKSLAEITGSHVDLDIPSEPLWVIGNAVELSRVIDNLIGNALKHNAPGTQVRINVEAEPEVVFIRVSDNGQGIPAEALDKVFEEGYRMNKEREGQGMGLSIVRTIIEKMGGTITVESTPGKGATFSLKMRRTGFEVQSQADRSDLPTDRYQEVP